MMRPCGSCTRKLSTALPTVVPPDPCDAPILAGPVDSDAAIEIARCATKSEAELLSLEGEGTRPEAAEGAFARWDVVLLGDGVVLAVGLAEGLEAGVAEYLPAEIFPGGSCAQTVALTINSADLVPHALTAGLGPLTGELGYRLASDCLADGTSSPIVLMNASGDRLIYTADGTLLESCLDCAAGDPRACCSL